MSTSEFKRFMDAFRERYPHIHCEQIKEEKIKAFLEQDFIKDRSLSTKMDFFSDYCLSQQLCDVSL